MDWKEALLNINLPDGGPLPADDAADDSRPVATGAPLLVELDRKGRRGKEATIISGFTSDDEGVAAIASQLKSRLGTGGSSRGGEILIQGDRRQQVVPLLTALGFKVKVR